MRDMKIEEMSVDQIIGHLNMMFDWKRRPHEGRFLQALFDKVKEQEAVLAHWDDDTGHWIEGDRNGINPHTRTTGEMIDTFRCSWCGFYQYWKTPFCPNCGAKMEGR